jgi:TP901 family phage tail tape measure protein
VAVNFDAVLRLVARVDGLQEIDRLRGAIGGVEGIAKDARRAFTNVTSSATWQAAAVGAAAIGAGLVSSVRVAMDFEQAMSAVAAKTQAGQEDMAKLTDLAKDLGRSTQFSAREVAEGMDFLAMAGFEVNDMLTAMPGLLNLAAAGNLDLASAADIVSNILGGMNMEASETGRVADVLARAATSSNVSVGMLGETFKFVAPVAAQAGAGLEDVAAAAGLLGDAGIQGSEAGTGLRSVLLRLAAPPTEAAKALERLGVSTKDASGNMRPFGEILADVDHSMKDLNLGSAEQIEIQNALFGKTAIASGAILQQAAANGELSAKTKELMESQGAAAEMAEIMNDNLAGAFKRLQSAIEGFQIQLVSGTNPALQGFVDFAANGINVLTDMMERFPLITSAVVALAAAFVALVALAPFIAAFISVIGSIKAVLAGIGFASIVAGWQTVAIVAFGAIKTAIAGFLTWVGATFIPALLAFFSGPVGWTVLAIAAVIAMAIAFREPIMNFFNWLGGAIRDGLNALWQWGEPIRQFWLNVWETVKGVVTGFWSWFTGAINEGIQALWQLGEPIRQFWLDTWETVKSVVTGFWSWFAGAINEGIQALWQLGDQIRDFWVNAWETVKGIVTAFIDWFGNAFQSLVQVVQSIGGQIASAFNSMVIQPIRNAWAAVTSWLGEAANTALSRIRGAWQMIATAFNTAVVTPIRTAWTTVTSWLSDTISGAVTAIQRRWQEITSGFMDVVVTPIRNAWGEFTGWLSESIEGAVAAIVSTWQSIAQAFTDRVVRPIQDAWTNMVQALQTGMQSIGDGIKGIFDSVIAAIRSAFNQAVDMARSAIQSIINEINRLLKLVGLARQEASQAVAQANAATAQANQAIAAANAKSAQASAIPLATGGVVDRATLAVVGEGGEREYIVPESKMAAASSRFLGGARGADVIPSGSGGGAPSQGHQTPVINITTGPVMEFDGRRFATIEDLQSAARQTATQIYATLRTPAGRRAIGVA